MPAAAHGDQTPRTRPARPTIVRAQWLALLGSAGLLAAGAPRSRVFRACAPALVIR